MFSGFNRGYGTWVQGEVAGNYSALQQQHRRAARGAQGQATGERHAWGAVLRLQHHRSTRGQLNLDGRELDLYAEWAVNEHLITTLLGLYKPNKSAENGGNQVGGNGTNVYSQLVVAVPF